MLTRVQKEDIVAKAKDRFVRSKSVVFIDYKGLTIPELDAMKKEMRKSGVEFRVIKKRLFKLSAKEAGVDIADELLQGQLAVAYSMQDEVSAAKIIESFAKKNDKVKVSGGVLENAVLKMEAVKALAKLPTRDELRAHLIGTIKAPITGFVRVLSGNIRGLVQALKAIQESR